MTALFLVGDVRERQAQLIAAGEKFDFVLCSPPFLALRSYLPPDHPDKAKEIGSEGTPAEFIDVLLELTAEWGRLLAPHGSIAIELGDSFSGSGGAGGDYDDEAWRGGQPRFGGSASKARESRWSYPDALWLAGVIDTEGSIIVHAQDRGDNSPSYRTDVCVSMMDRQVCDRAAEIAGVGNVNRDGRGVYSWHVSAQQARYVLVNIWPYLLIKQRQAQAAIELQRHIEEHRGRGRYNPLTATQLEYREMIRGYVSGLNARGELRGVYQPTWTPPTPPRVRHSLLSGTGWPMDKSLCAIPALYQVALAYGINPLTGRESPAGRWRVRNLKPWIRSNPPVGALGDKERPATSYVIVATRARDRWFDLDAVRTPHVTADALTRPRTAGGREQARVDVGLSSGNGESGSNAAGAPPRDWWHHVDAILDAGLEELNKAGSPGKVDLFGVQLDSTEEKWTTRGTHLRRRLERASILTTHDALDISPRGYSGAHYAVWPPELVRQLVDEMCPRRVCTTCGEPSRRIVETSRPIAADDSQRRKNANGERPHIGRQDRAPELGWQVDRQTLGWSDCGHATWRPGRILDPFVGSGTTIAVATGMGRDAVGIDIDERNLELAYQRVGMFLTVHYPNHEATA